MSSYLACSINHLYEYYNINHKNITRFILPIFSSTVSILAVDNEPLPGKEYLSDYVRDGMMSCSKRNQLFFSDDQDFSTSTDKLRISCITDGAKPTRYVPLIKRYTRFLRLISPDFDFIRYHGEILLLVAWKLLRSRLHERKH